MLKALLHKMIARFETSYDYDASYMHQINSVSPSASVRLMMISGLTNFHGDCKAIWGGAAFAATLHGDCGPCAQLIIDRLLEQGLNENELVACLNKDWPTASATGLGFVFAQATLNNEDSLESIRAAIIKNHGKKALVAASFATVSYPVYPLLKRALGSAESCQSLVIGRHQNVKVVDTL